MLYTMNAYSTENYSTFQDFVSTFNQELSAVLSLPTPIRHEVYGIGRIVAVKACPTTADFIISVDFEEINKMFSWTAINRLQLLEISEANKDTYQSCLKLYSVNFAAYKAEQEAKQILARAEAEKAKLAAKEKLAAEKRKIKALERLKSMKPDDVAKSFNSPQTFYETLGWIARHIKIIKPTMPSDMEPWFLSNFGNVDRTVVDSDKKTSGGNAMKYSISFKATFDTELSGILASKASGNAKKVIDSVTFIWDLIKNYGFKFGAQQDIDHIMSTIPDTYLPEFSRGYGVEA